jgi:putative FmdB family regulatory protein
VPLYEYYCKKCDRVIEKIQKFSDPILTKCETCEGELERLLSSPAIQFKGSGWYVTDYSRKSAPKEGDKPAGTPAPSDEKKAGNEKETPKPAKSETSKD